MRKPPKLPNPFDIPNHSPLTARVSEAKLRANRRNAKKSTGPRTPEGKARSSRNALKNGIIARAGPLFEDAGAEDVALFNEVLDELRDTYRPVERYQEILLRRAALCYVRITRARRLENQWAKEHRRKLRASALHEAERKQADLDRQIAECQSEELSAELYGLRAKRASVQRRLEFQLENADLLGALPEHDRAGALIRYEGSAHREASFIARQLECMVRHRSDVWHPCIAPPDAPRYP